MPFLFSPERITQHTALRWQSCDENAWRRTAPVDFERAHAVERADSPRDLSVISIHTCTEQGE